MVSCHSRSGLGSNSIKCRHNSQVSKECKIPMSMDNRLAALLRILEASSRRAAFNQYSPNLQASSLNISKHSKRASTPSCLQRCNLSKPVSMDSPDLDLAKHLHQYLPCRQCHSNNLLLRHCSLRRLVQHHRSDSALQQRTSWCLNGQGGRILRQPVSATIPSICLLELI